MGREVTHFAFTIVNPTCPTMRYKTFLNPDIPLRYAINPRPSCCRPLTQTKEVKWSYMQGPSETPLLGVTIGQLLQHRAEQHPDRLAISVRHQEKRVTFEQLIDAVYYRHYRCCFL